LLSEGATPEVQRAIKQASRRIEGPHLTQNDYKRETLHLLSKKQKPMKAKEIVDEFYSTMHDRFSQDDIKILKGGRQRWDETLRYTIYGFLKMGGYIEDRGKNQYVITEKGRQLLTRFYEVPSGKVQVQVQ
jgi:Fic family protein